MFLAGIAAASALPSAVAAQGPVPAVARYRIQFGASAPGPSIGTLRQKLSRDCQQWQLERDVTVEPSFGGSPALRIEQRLRASETRRGDSLTYELTRLRSDSRQQIFGTVTTLGNSGGHAALRYPSGPLGLDLPARTSLPVDGLARLIERLRQGGERFSLLTFDPETIGDAMNVDVDALPGEALRPRFADPAPQLSLAMPHWSVDMAFTPVRNAPSAPVYTVRAMIWANGMIDRLTVRSGLFTFAADLLDWQPIEPPRCAPG